MKTTEPNAVFLRDCLNQVEQLLGKLLQRR